MGAVTVDFRFPQQVTRLRRERIPGPYGGDNTFPSWEDPEHPAAAVPLPNCFIAPISSNETDGAGRTQTLDTLALYGPVGLDIVATDRVRDAAGNVYDVAGTPLAYTSPFTGWAAGLVVPLRRARG